MQADCKCLHNRDSISYIFICLKISICALNKYLWDRWPSVHISLCLSYCWEGIVYVGAWCLSPSAGEEEEMNIVQHEITRMWDGERVKQSIAVSWLGSHSCVKGTEYSTFYPFLRRYDPLKVLGPWYSRLFLTDQLISDLALQFVFLQIEEKRMVSPDIASP